MRIVGFVGSPRKGGSTETVVKSILEGAASRGAETRLYNVAAMDIGGCVACMHCRKNDGCSQKDDMQKMYEEIASADAVVLGSPIYMFQVTAQMKAFIDRLYPYLNPDFSSKIKKRAVLVTLQGNPDTSLFAPYLETTKRILGVLGFHVETTLSETLATHQKALAGAAQLGASLAAGGK